MAESDGGGDSSATQSVADAADCKIDFTDQRQHDPVKIKVKVPHKTFCYFEQFTKSFTAFKKRFPLKGTGYTTEDQKHLFDALQCVFKQPHRQSKKGKYVILTETYSQAKNGFPGRLCSTGIQGMLCAIRSNFLSETADLDMKNAQPRCISWVCKYFANISTPCLDDYIANTDDRRKQIAGEEKTIQPEAKRLPIMAYNSEKPLRCKGDYMKQFDKEAKEVQKKLIAISELQWLLPFCNETNKAGSFISRLYNFIECKLLLRVYKMLRDEFGLKVAALIFDGLNVADKSKHGDQGILNRARDVCEEVCPGINMEWAWKELDFVLKNNKKEPLTNPDESYKELRVPDDFKPPKCGGGDSGGGLLDPSTEPGYEQLRSEFSLGLGGRDRKSVV